MPGASSSTPAIGERANYYETCCTAHCNDIELAILMHACRCAQGISKKTIASVQPFCQMPRVQLFYCLLEREDCSDKSMGRRDPEGERVRLWTPTKSREAGKPRARMARAEEASGGSFSCSF